MKKTSILALGLLISLKPAMGMSWTEMGHNHPLYTKLLVKEVQVNHDFLVVTQKELGRVKCTKSVLPRLSPIGSSQSQITCLVPDDLNSVESQELFEKVDVTLVDTYGAYTHYKQVGKLLMVGSDDSEEGRGFARVYTSHPCQKVANQNDAEKCMSFFATKLQPSFEDINSSALIPSTRESRTKAHEVFKIFGPWMAESSQVKLKNAPYIGMMVQHVYAGRHINYYTVSHGQNVLPERLLNISLEDMGYAVEDIIEGMSEGELKDFIKKLSDNMFLGLPKDTFPAFAEELEYGFDYL